MRRVDAHHHLWDPARRAYPWMDERLAPFQRRFGLEDLDAAAGPHGIGQTVVVQTVASVEETKEFLAVAGAGGRVAGVVGWVDLSCCRRRRRRRRAADGARWRGPGRGPPPGP